MERGSDKVSPRVDDEMKHELQALLQSGTAESHTEEWLEKEPSGDDQPEVDAFGGEGL